jgi:hypothetical protein
MTRLLLTSISLLTLAVALSAAPAPDQVISFVDLQPKANQKLNEPFHSTTAGNTLEDLGKGEKKLTGVRFKIGASCIQLGSKMLNKPEKVEGIKVDRFCVKLHILHACGWSDVPDGTVIGRYVLHYEDKKEETIEIVYGKDVRDWWFGPQDKEVDRGKVAWKGDNDPAKAANKRIRLYLTTWKNPKPEKKVVSIDYVSTKTTAGAPFCVAMTLEEK